MPTTIEVPFDVFIHLGEEGGQQGTDEYSIHDVILDIQTKSEQRELRRHHKMIKDRVEEAIVQMHISSETMKACVTLLTEKRDNLAQMRHQARHHFVERHSMIQMSGSRFAGFTLCQIEATILYVMQDILTRDTQ